MIPYLPEEVIKMQAIHRFFIEQGVRIPEAWSIQKICDAVTDIHLMKRRVEYNGFVRVYAHMGVPRFMLNREPFARDWNKLVETGFNPLTEKHDYVTMRI